MSVGVGRHPKYTFWQPCCRNLATLTVLHFPKYSIRLLTMKNIDIGLKNHVSTAIRRKVMSIGVGRHQKYAFW